MAPIYPRIRMTDVRESKAEALSGERLLARDVVRIVLFVPYDHFEIAAGVAHALDEYLRAVEGRKDALFQYTNCYWEPFLLDELGWQRIRGLLAPKEHRYADDYTDDEIHHAIKDGADPYFGIYGEPTSGFDFEYYARIPWRLAPPESISLLRVTLPTEYLEERGASAVRELALALASRLPFASGHAGLAVEVYSPDWDRRTQLLPVLMRHPAFDIRNAGIRDEMGSRVDGIHWLNFLGPPVLGELGGAEHLRGRLHSPSTDIRRLDGERVLVTLGAEPEAGDMLHAPSLPAYRELARVLEPWLEPFAWGAPHTGTRGREGAWRQWWRRFLD